MAVGPVTQSMLVEGAQGLLKITRRVEHLQQYGRGGHAHPAVNNHVGNQRYIILVSPPSIIIIAKFEGGNNQLLGFEESRGVVLTTMLDSPFNL